MIFEEFLRIYSLDSSKDYTKDSNFAKLLGILAYVFLIRKDRKLEISYDRNGNSWEFYLDNIGYGRGSTLPEALIALYTSVPLLDTFNNNKEDIKDANALKLLVALNDYD